MLIAESKEKLKSLLMKVKESEKTGLKLNVQKLKFMAFDAIVSWTLDGETMETVTDFILGGLQNYCKNYSERRQWRPTPVLLPGKSHRRRSLVGCSPWGR